MPVLNEFTPSNTLAWQVISLSLRGDLFHLDASTSGKISRLFRISFFITLGLELSDAKVHEP